MIKINLEDSWRTKKITDKSLMRFVPIASEERRNRSGEKKEYVASKSNLMDRQFFNKHILIFTGFLIAVGVGILIVLTGQVDNSSADTNASNVTNDYISKITDLISSTKNFDIRLISNVQAIKQNNPELAEFFLTAQNGDILMLLADLELVFIYRPSESKIVNAAKMQLQR